MCKLLQAAGKEGETSMACLGQGTFTKVVFELSFKR